MRRRNLDKVVDECAVAATSLFTAWLEHNYRFVHQPEVQLSALEPTFHYPFNSKMGEVYTKEIGKIVKQVGTFNP